MKTRKLTKFTALTALVLAVTSLSSCLKDPRFVNYAGVTPFVELPLAAANGAFTPEAFTIVATPITLPLAVNYAAPKPRTSPLTVTLKVDQAALDAYNKANNTSFTILPAADYSIASLTLTIPAGQNTATVAITINISKVDPNGSFILPISIADGGGVAISASSTILYNVQAKNKYDGIWTVNGTMTDFANSTLTGNYPVTYYLETQGSASDGMFDPSQGGFLHEILASGTLNAYGSYAPVFTFDPTTNKITSVVNYYGQPAGNGRSAALDPTGVNAFTYGSPGTVGATFQVSYFLNQPAVISGGPRTSFNETWTYVGPRP
jgi:hypothetical protein